MNINVEEPSALRRKLTIEIEPEEIKRELDSAYNELKRGVQLKGFRQGHAPRNLLERFFGDQVRSEVVQKLVKEYTGKALEEKNLKPVVAPEIVTEETDLKKSLKFSASFDLKPELVVKDYEGLKVPESTFEITDKDVDDAIELLRERQATLKKVDGRTVVNEGDYVLGSIEGFEDGKPLSGVKSEDRLLEVSKRNLAHGLDEILAGSEVGKPARGVKTYAADYEQKELAGKTVEWRANLKEIFRRELPGLDDDFAKDQGEQSLDDLKKRVRDDLTKKAQQEADARVRQALLDLVLERNPVEVPESLMNRERSAMESELHNTLEAAGVPHEKAQEQVRASADDIKSRAEKRAKTALTLDALADQEKVEVSDEDVGDRIARAVTAAGRDRDRAAEFYRREENREALKQVMRREKTLDLIFQRAQKTSLA